MKKDLSKKGVKVGCRSCKHEWTYKGGFTPPARVCCPRCGNRNRLPEK